MEDLRKRCELDKNDCWDISKIIKDEKEYQDLVTAVKKENQKIVSMRGHILDSKDSLTEYLKTNEKEERSYAKLLLYTRFLYDEDTRNNEAKNKMLEIENLANVLSESESFVTSELMKKDLEDVLKLLDDDKYVLYFKRLYKQKKRVLSEKEEENSKQKQQLEENSTQLKENAKLLKEKDLALLKLLMKAEKLDFDEAFNTLKLSENLRVSYKKEIYGE